MTAFHFKNSWPKTERAKKYQLFASRLLELVHPKAQDIYRVHALSTPAKLTELRRASNAVLNGTHPKPTIFPIIEETNEALQSDPIVAKIAFDAGLSPADLSFETQQSTEEIIGRASLWLRILQQKYKKNIEKEIISTINSNKKYKLILFTKLYISHLIEEGFHRSFIRDRTEETFFSKDIGRCTDNLLKKFFNHFSGRTINYDVAIHVPDELAKSMRNSFRIKTASNEEETVKLLGFHNSRVVPSDNLTLVLFENAKSPDPYSAVKRVNPALSIPKAFNAVYPNTKNISIEDDCFVVDRAKHDVYHIPVSEVFRPVHSFTSSLNYNASLFPDFAHFAWAGAQWDDYDVLLSLGQSFESAIAALSTGSPQAQLVSIWSAFEALLPEPTRDEKSVRIKHFARLISPCITHKYLKGKFRIFIDDIPHHLSMDSADLFDQDLKRSDRPRHLARILQTDDSEKSRLFQKLSQSPLLCSRLFELSKIASDPKIAENKLASHERRVNWQIHRIYRQRNQIVHSGKTDSFLPTLVENAFLYYRLTVRGLQTIHVSDKIHNPDSALQLLQVRHDKRKQAIANSRKEVDIAKRNSQLLDAIFHK